jgi:ParB-like chromosome segregation protein Spo0J
MNSLIKSCSALFSSLEALPEAERVAAINEIRLELSKYSPFRSEPVDCVQWVRADRVTANDYNPNSVAPPEMKLLEHSITQDGYTQPIVSWSRDDVYEVVDGFHRHRVGKECKAVRERVKGYLPLVVINTERQERSDRIAATIRHNRARGKHKVEAMSDIVIELKRRNWSDERIAKELGMDADEVLRLCQITGLAEAFKDQAFSEAWEVDKDTGAANVELITDVIPDFEADDGDRILHTWDKWECYRAGFYKERPDEMTQEEGEGRYTEFLASPAFEQSLKAVTSEWKYSCEHFLTNDRMNRIAWLGQASVAHALGIPSCCRGGYHRLSDQQKYDADMLATKYLNYWLKDHGRQQLMRADAMGRTEAELY